MAAVLVATAFYCTEKVEGRYHIVGQYIKDDTANTEFTDVGSYINSGQGNPHRSNVTLIYINLELTLRI